LVPLASGGYIQDTLDCGNSTTPKTFATNFCHENQDKLAFIVCRTDLSAWLPANTLTLELFHFPKKNSAMPYI
jgi:hypothetical protein